MDLLCTQLPSSRQHNPLQDVVTNCYFLSWVYSRALEFLLQQVSSSQYQTKNYALSNIALDAAESSWGLWIRSYKLARERHQDELWHEDWAFRSVCFILGSPWGQLDLPKKGSPIFLYSIHLREWVTHSVSNCLSSGLGHLIINMVKSVHFL